MHPLILMSLFLSTPRASTSPPKAPLGVVEVRGVVSAIRMEKSKEPEHHAFVDFGSIASTPPGEPEILMIARELDVQLWPLQAPLPTTRAFLAGDWGTCEAKPVRWVALRILDRAQPEEEAMAAPLHRALEVIPCASQTEATAAITMPNAAAQLRALDTSPLAAKQSGLRARVDEALLSGGFSHASKQMVTVPGRSGVVVKVEPESSDAHVLLVPSSGAADTVKGYLEGVFDLEGHTVVLTQSIDRPDRGFTLEELTDTAAVKLGRAAAFE